MGVKERRRSPHWNLAKVVPRSRGVGRDDRDRQTSNFDASKSVRRGVSF